MTKLQIRLGVNPKTAIPVITILGWQMTTCIYNNIFLQKCKYFFEKNIYFFYLLVKVYK